MLKELKNRLSEIEGSVLGIGLNDKLARKLEDNDKITFCDLLEYGNDEDSSDYSSNVINIRDLTKKYKNKIDYLVINYKIVKKYEIFIFKYMNNLPNKQTIIYNIKDKEKIKNRFLKLNIDYIINNDIIIIEPNKNSRYKTILYFYMDKINYQLDKLIDILNK